MTPQEHLAEITRLADEMRPHVEALPGAIVARVNATWPFGVEVQFKSVNHVLALAPDATPYVSTTNEEPWRFCFAKVDGVKFEAAERIEAETATTPEKGCDPSDYFF